MIEIYGRVRRVRRWDSSHRCCRNLASFIIFWSVNNCESQALLAIQNWPTILFVRGFFFSFPYQVNPKLTEAIGFNKHNKKNYGYFMMPFNRLKWKKDFEMEIGNFAGSHVSSVSAPTRGGCSALISFYLPFYLLARLFVRRKLFAVTTFSTVLCPCGMSSCADCNLIYTFRSVFNMFIMGIMADSELDAFISPIYFILSVRNVLYGNRTLIKSIWKVRSVARHEFAIFCCLCALIGRGQKTKTRLHLFICCFGPWKIFPNSVSNVRRHKSWGFISVLVFSFATGCLFRWRGRAMQWACDLFT